MKYNFFSIRFKAKYHPDECDKKRAEQKAAVKRRCDVFLELMNTGWLDSLELDCEKQKDIAKVYFFPPAFRRFSRCFF